MQVGWAIVVVVAALAAAWLACAAAGCARPVGPRTVKSDELAVKVPAIKEAVAKHDASAVAQLVKDLESDDAAVRFFAIQGLRKLTGQEFGYVYYADRERREQAMMKWRQWLERQELHERSE